MTNAETLKNAETAPRRDHVAPSACDLSEYSFCDEDGSPEGCVFAEDHEEAARLWGFDMLHGCSRRMQVWGPGDACGRWFRIERGAEDVSAHEVSS